MNLPLAGFAAVFYVLAVWLVRTDDPFGWALAGFATVLVVGAVVIHRIEHGR